MKNNAWFVGLILFTGLVFAQDHRVRMFEILDDENNDQSAKVTGLDICAEKLAKVNSNMKDEDGISRVEWMFESKESAKLILIKWIQLNQLKISQALCNHVDVVLTNEDEKLAKAYRLPSTKIWEKGRYRDDEDSFPDSAKKY